MVLALPNVKLEAVMPPNDTPVAPQKLDPVMVMVVPAAAVLGVKEIMIGGAGALLVFLNTEIIPESARFITTTAGN